MSSVSHRSPGDLVSPGGRTPLPIGEYLFASVSAAIGIYIIVAANFIRVPVSSTSLGPRAFPYLVGGLLLAAAVVVLVGIIRGRLGEAEEGEDVDSSAGTDWITVAKLVVFFVLHAYLITFIGWPLAAALLFMGSAWALGASKLWKTALIGVCLAAVIQFVFGTVLGLSLPLGPLLDWIPFL